MSSSSKTKSEKKTSKFMKQDSRCLSKVMDGNLEFVDMMRET